MRMVAGPPLGDALWLQSSSITKYFCSCRVVDDGAGRELARVGGQGDRVGVAAGPAPGGAGSTLGVGDVGAARRSLSGAAVERHVDVHGAVGGRDRPRARRHGRRRHRGEDGWSRPRSATGRAAPRGAAAALHGTSGPAPARWSPVERGRVNSPGARSFCQRSRTPASAVTTTGSAPGTSAAGRRSAAAAAATAARSVSRSSRNANTAASSCSASNADPGGDASAPGRGRAARRPGRCRPPAPAAAAATWNSAR